MYFCLNLLQRQMSTCLPWGCKVGVTDVIDLVEYFVVTELSEKSWTTNQRRNVCRISERLKKREELT